VGFSAEAIEAMDRAAMLDKWAETVVAGNEVQSNTNPVGLMLVACLDMMLILSAND
jgi:hypothetical protein